MSLIKTIFYKTLSNKQPCKKWLSNLDETTEAIILSRLKRLTLGNFGDCKVLKNCSGIYELRIDYGPGYRIYFGKQGPLIVILLLGGDKGSQDRDIVKAQKYWIDYQGDEHGK